MLTKALHTSPITHNVNINEDVRGFFRTTYVAANPASLEPTTPLPSNAYFAGVSMPSLLRPGQIAQALVVFQNVGGTTWTAGGPNPFRLGAQNPGQLDLGPDRVELPYDVGPGDEVVFQFPVTAPTAPGTCHFQWRMVQDGVTWFGDFTSDIPVVVAPVLRSMTTAVSPATLPIRMPVSVTVTAADRVTGAPVPGNVVGGVAKGITGTPFTLTIPANRRLVDGEWEWVPVVPAGSVEAPGYNPGAVVFDVIS